MTKIETQTPATAGIQNEAILEADTNNPTALESPSEFFSHGEGDSPRSHAAEKTRLSVLGFAVLLTLSFSVIELVGGWWANSLALIGDAGHMVTDSMSLLFALVANRLAMKGADEAHSFGHGRVEVIAAFVNGLTLLGVTFWLFYEAIERIREPAAVAGGSVMVIAFAGLLINVAVAWSLSRDRQNVNTRAALLHVLGDLLGSVAAIAAGGIIWAGGPAIVDPLLSMFVGLLLLRATWKVLSESVRILLDGTPEQTLMLSANTSAQCPVWMKFMIFIYGRLPRGMMLCSATCALLRTSAGRGSCTPFAKASRGALISTTLRFSPSGKAWDRAGIVKVRSA